MIKQQISDLEKAINVLKKLVDGKVTFLSPNNNNINNIFIKDVLSDIAKIVISIYASYQKS